MEKTSLESQTTMSKDQDQNKDQVKEPVNEPVNDQKASDATETASSETATASLGADSNEITKGSAIKFALGHLAMEGDDITPSHALLGAEELEMMPAPLFPDINVEPGTELLQSMDEIPFKMAFKIGEAAEMVGVKQYVLRYWETEFDVLRPRKSKNGQRVYSRRDVETAMMIKKLLYEDRFSIEGARTALRQLKSHVKEERDIRAVARSQQSAVMKLKGLVGEIRRIRDIFL
jgi:DNA-binding transcriptional MerR regulator